MLPASYLVSKTVDDGTANTLRWAIIESNKTVGVRDTINFAIGIGARQPVTLGALTAALPPITDSVFIDGFSQANNGLASTPYVEIDGTGIMGTGLTVNCGNTLIEGLAISKFGGNGIELNNPAGSVANWVYGCNIGSGLSGLSNTSGNQGDGIAITGANNRIGFGFGVSGPARGTLISGNTLYGVHISGAGATNNILNGNGIGVDATYLAAIANLQAGVLIESGASGNHIGDETMPVGVQNVISGNSRDGIQINNSSSNFVYADYIGLGSDGRTAIGNGRNGVYVLSGSTNNRIDTDVISANASSGVRFSGPDVTANRVVNSEIGTDLTGTLARGNVINGVAIDTSVSNTIGGTGLGNTISGNGQDGVLIAGNTNSVIGNEIGTNSAGTAALANGGNGVSVIGNNNHIGLATVGGGNLISGNGASGVLITGNSNEVFGDTIGTNRAGTMALRNVTNGVTINGSSNSVGTAGAIVQNLISGNGADGIYISGGSNKVYGSQIGTNQLGTAAIANGTNGVEISGNNNEVGSALNGGGNLISGNGNEGVFITGDVNTVAGNLIGTTASGNAALPNASTGLDVNGNNNPIGLATDLGRNVISGNGYLGVNLSGSNNTVANNYIGVGKDGTTKVGNSKSGLVVVGVQNLIGGELGADTRNVISANGGNGIVIRLYGGNRVQGNYIGLSWIGTSKTKAGITLNLGNSLDGIYIERSTGNTVGGTLLADRNYICGSTDFGVEMGVGATSNTVQNNAIGMCFDPNNLMGALIVAANLQGWKKDGPGTNTWTADNVHN